MLVLVGHFVVVTVVMRPSMLVQVIPFQVDEP